MLIRLQGFYAFQLVALLALISPKAALKVVKDMGRIIETSELEAELRAEL